MKQRCRLERRRGLLLGLKLAMQSVDLLPIAVYQSPGGIPVSEERAFSIAKPMSGSG